MSAINVRKIGGQWHVTCSTCAGDGFFEMLLGTWVRATTQRVAMLLAVWHAELHEKAQCTACLHVPPVARPVIVDGKTGLLRLDGQLYAVTRAGVRVMEPTP